MEKSNLASILQRKKNKNLTLAHRQLWGMIDLVYKDFYDKESKIFDAGNVTREEFAIIKHVYKTRHVVTYTELKTLLNNKHLSHVNRPLNVRPKILTLRRSVFLWQNIA